MMLKKKDLRLLDELLTPWFYVDCHPTVKSEGQPEGGQQKKYRHSRPKQLLREQSVGSFSNDDGEGNEYVKKAIVLSSKTTTLRVQHTFLVHFPVVNADYDVKMPNFTFHGGRKEATTNFSFSC